MTEAGEFTRRDDELLAAAQSNPHPIKFVWALCLDVVAGSILGCGGSAGASGPNLAVSISHQSFTEGATFTISINNTGNAAATGPITLALSGTVVPGPAVVPGNGWSCVPPSGGLPNQFATCTNPGPILPGSGGGVISVSYNIATVFFSGNPVNPPTSYSLGISANVSAPGNIVTGASDGVTIPLAAFPFSGPSAALSFRLTHAGLSFAAGGTGSYLFAVQNSSDVESPDSVDVTVNLPPGFTYASSSGTGWVCGGGQVVSCTFAGPIAAGASSEVTLSIAVDASLSGTVTSSWSTSLGLGTATSLFMSDLVLVEPSASSR